MLTCCRSRKSFLLTILGTVSSLPLSAQPLLDSPEAITGTMERLSIRLPSSVAESAAVRKPLEELTREHCDQQAIVGLGKALDQAGYRREAATAHVSFSDSCGGHASSLRIAVNTLIKLSDYASAATIASRLIELEPFSYTGYF